MCAARVLLAPGWNAAAGQSGTRVCPLHANEWHGGDPALIQATLTLTLTLTLTPNPNANANPNPPVTSLT